VIDVEPLIRAELERRVPLPPGELAGWEDVLRRADVRRSRRRPVLGALVAAAVVLAVLAATPLGGAVVRTVGGFSDWLTGTPGEPAPQAEQRRFERFGERSWASWPERPRLRELLRTRVGGATYVLFGFRTGEAVCLRLRVEGIARSGPALACLPLSELERSRDLVIPVKGNVSFGAVGPRPRVAGDPPTVPLAITAFGFAADEAVRVDGVTDEGRHPALLGNGAFLFVADGPRRGTWIRRVIVRDARGRERAAPIAVEVSGESTRATGMRVHGPARVERVVRGGTIRWFVRREPRGAPFEGAELPRLGTCCLVGSFVRLIQPVRGDFLRMLVAESDQRGEICAYLVTRGGIGGNCVPLRQKFRRGPMALSWGFSGVGQQFWIVDGLVSDDVARVEIFLGTGERIRAPLRDNVVIARVQRAKFPARVVGYDLQGRVIGVETIRAR
jgi:hypothetical protein